MPLDAQWLVQGTLLYELEGVDPGSEMPDDTVVADYRSGGSGGSGASAGSATAAAQVGDSRCSLARCVVDSTLVG